MFGHLPRFLRRFGLAGLPMYAALRSRREVQIRVPGLRAPVRLRAGTSDRSIFITTFLDEENRVEHPGTPRFIVDAGANVGLTALWFARRWPDAVGMFCS